MNSISFTFIADLDLNFDHFLPSLHNILILITLGFIELLQ